MSIQIRPAEASDTNFVAEILLLAGRSHLPRGGWDVFFDAPQVDCLDYLRRLAMAEARSFSHYSRFLLAEVDGSAASALCGYDPQDATTALFEQAISEVAQRSNWNPEETNTFWQRLGPYMTCAFEEDAGTWVIENVATLPRFRRLGLARVLLQQALDTGRERGHKTAQISMDIGNLAARQAYESVGFRLVGEKRHPDYEQAFGVPGRWRLTRKL